MKHLAPVLLVVCLWCSLSCSAQTKPSAPLSNDKAQPNTTLEAFMGKRGQMIVKEFYPLGRLAPGGLGNGVVNLDAVVISEPNNPQKTKGLRVEVIEVGQLERSSLAFVDFEELESLSQALAYTADLAAKWNTQQHAPYTEVTYISKGDMQIGFFQKDKSVKAYCRAGEIGASTVYLNTSALSQLKALVDQATALLKEK